MDKELKVVRQVTGTYHPCDVYNRDETALFWKRSPERSLATSSEPGHKALKSHVTIAVCGNGDGSDKVRLLIVLSCL
jgi:NAD(P)H-flavin reductase